MTAFDNGGTQDSRRVGEVVEANSTSFAAQCYRLYDAPPLGSFVRAGDPAVYGVIDRVTTETLDATRPVLARGESAASEEEIFRNNPQLERLLTSRFEVLIVGHQDRDISVPVLPPLPPRVHAFVHTCSSEDAVRLAGQTGWIRSLLSSGIPVADQVVGACLREAASAHEDGPGFLMRACKDLAGELAGDLPRLNAILRTVRP